MIFKRHLAEPALIDVVRRAYVLWEQAGRPEGRDQQFYLEAERELQSKPEGMQLPEVWR